MIGARHNESNPTYMKKKDTQISTFSHGEQDIEVLYHKGKISYVFEYGSKRFGNAVKVAGNTKQDIVNAAFALAVNYLSTYAKVKAGK